MSDKPMYVTQPHLPPLEEFVPYLEKIWESKRLTNNGPFHQQLEHELCEYLGVPEIALFNNGTIALIAALKALDLTGEVITTPYSFVATAHALLWNNLRPVFVDVDPVTLNLDPARIEAAITPRTTAILPVHCYGTPCDTKAIQEIADKHQLRVVYDAAHAFGVRDEGGSILRHGDLSVLSFHATKVFNTFEGGAIVCHDPETKRRIDILKNFGFADDTTVEAAGFNGKMNEVQAAFGLLQLKYVDEAITRRSEIDDYYRIRLAGVEGVRTLSRSAHTAANHAYFPILVDSSYPLTRDQLHQTLRNNNIFARRYFYPLIANFPMYRDTESADHDNLPVANTASERIICLPIHSGIDDVRVDAVVDVIKAP